jgi:HSP20 family protein
MTNLIHWNPLRELSDISNCFSGLMNRGSFFNDEVGEPATVRADWMPVVDISEDDSTYRIEAEVPGIAREDIQVTVDQGTLSLSGERKSQEGESKGQVHRTERCYGSFRRNFRLPEDAEADTVKAEFKNGLLRVTVAKAEQPKPRQIEVKVS